MKVKIEKNYHVYSTAHNFYMVMAIRNYPGITVDGEDPTFIYLTADKYAEGFLKHLSEIDDITYEEVE